ncbi:MAG TPA: hypothetical protein VK864_15025 [Longimicrobiales bacterium]|nr:hypothetical protein [Longimicrobiales bacterium]
MSWQRVLVISSCLAMSGASAVQAQLRPLEPLDPELWTGPKAQLQLGFGWLDEQRASLAGTTGDLFELGEARALIRVDRVILEFAGTPHRWFREHAVFAAPTGGARPAEDGRRHDSGDYRVVTAIRLAAANARVLPVLRFGTRLPTTNNRIGLERDALDFFALVSAHHQPDRWSFDAEAGLARNGTRLSNYEQSDVLAYAGTVSFRAGNLRPRVAVLGQKAFHDRVIRGNEDLGELRAGVRIGGARWIEVTFLHGYETFSPRFGILAAGGLKLDWN